MTDYVRQYNWDNFDATNAVAQAAQVQDELDLIVTAITSKEDAANKGQANGYAALDGSGDVPAANLPAATETAQGAIEIATTAEAQAGTDNTRAMTPQTVESWAAQNAGMVQDVSNLTDPNDDRILGWDDSAGTVILYDLTQGLESNGAVLQVNHDAAVNFVANEHIDHSNVTITAGAGLTGGGNITVSRTLTLDISGLPTMTGSQVAATDSILVNDNGVMKQMDFQDMGVRVVNLDANQTFGLDDANTLQVMTGTDAHTWTVPANATVAFQIGTVILVHANATADTLTLSPAPNVTFNSIFGEGSTANITVFAGGTALLIKIATDRWAISGDLT